MLGKDVVSRGPAGEGCEFSLRHYEGILDLARAKGYQILPLSAFEKAQATRTLLLRHDVDVSVERAVEMAELEARKGLQATYFIRLHARYYDVREAATGAAVKELERLADVGLHYERTYYTQIGEDHLRMLQRDAEELHTLTRRATLGCAAHLPGMYPPFDEMAVRAAGMSFEAYAPGFVQQRKYISDSSRRWREGCLCTWLGKSDHLTVLMHPVWWTAWPEPPERVIQRIRDGD